MSGFTNGYSNQQLGSGIDSLYTPDINNILKDTGFTDYASEQNIDLNAMTPDTLKSLASHYKFNPDISHNGLGKVWGYSGILDSIGGLVGTDGQTLKDIGGGLGNLAGLGSTIFGMYNKNQGLKLAKDDYNFQKGLTLKKIAQADADRNRFLSNQKAATAQYYGK